jgi:hypothetical protein
LAQKYVGQFCFEQQLTVLFAAEIVLVWHMALNSTRGSSPKSAGDSILSSCYRFIFEDGLHSVIHVAVVQHSDQVAD